MTGALQARFEELVSSGRLDLPAGGATLNRWRALAAVAAEDLALVKLFEGHADALAILAEIGGPSAVLAHDGTIASWAVWAAEPPNARLRITVNGADTRLDGVKAWCSGAPMVSHALVTAWDSDGAQRLAAVAMDQPGVRIGSGAWHAIGMGRVPTPDVLFENAIATAVGGAGQYTARPGFWHGGCGLAACWYGGCLPLAETLRGSLARTDDPHLAAHLGAVDVALSALRALLVDTATWIDANPIELATERALRLRSAADLTATSVLGHVGRALGAGPLCRDATMAQHFADLPVFIRQTHAERDLADLARLVASSPAAWQL